MAAVWAGLNDYFWTDRPGQFSRANIAANECKYFTLYSIKWPAQIKSWAEEMKLAPMLCRPITSERDRYTNDF
jgi:hypothetical protein